MLNTSARLLKLLSLLQTRRYWPGAELAGQLDIDPRTLRRDVDKLRQLGINVRASAGVGGGYQLDAGHDMQPLLFDDDEAVTIAVALRAASLIIGGIEETSMRLLAKLDQLLPARLKRQASAVHAVTASLPVNLPKPDMDVLIMLSAACRDRRVLRFAYESHAGVASHREVEPHNVINYGRRWYLIAWDRQRNDWRTFRVDRMQATYTTDLRMPQRELGMDPRDYLQRAISIAPHERRVTLRVNETIDALRPRIPAWLGTLDAIDPQTTRLTLAADADDITLAQLAMVDADWQLEAPQAHPELFASLQRLNQRMHRHAPLSAPAAATPQSPTSSAQ